MEEPQKTGGVRRTSAALVMFLQLCPCLLLALILLLVTITIVHLRPPQPQPHSLTLSLSQTLPNRSFANVCAHTLHAPLCMAMANTSRTTSTATLSIASHVLDRAVSLATSRLSHLFNVASSSFLAQEAALPDCLLLFENAIDILKRTPEILTNLKLNENQNVTTSMPRFLTALRELQNLLSSTITLMDTCYSSFMDFPPLQFPLPNSSFPIQSQILPINRFLSVGLAMTDLLKVNISDVKVDGPAVAPPMASWLDNLAVLEEPGHRFQLDKIADIAVDKDGANFTSISQAIEASPSHSARRFVIYVKAGVYHENVVVPRSKINIFLFGDGMDRTVVSGNRSFKDGFTTFRSATFAVEGRGFVARDITFENTAGPTKGQAVALRVGSDMAAFQRCKIKGYQDTLYAYNHRHFYRDCHIHGTVDFIFGNAAAVFQKCVLFTAKPVNGQRITVTAQGRSDPNQNTGFSFLDCIVTAAPDIISDQHNASLAPTYLGRPWRNYSRTVFLRSFLDDIVHPEGWLPWSHGDRISPTRVYYAEYGNSGPGAATGKRVKWPGYHVISNISEALQFTAAEFITASEWLPSTYVDFFGGLSEF